MNFSHTAWRFCVSVGLACVLPVLYGCPCVEVTGFIDSESRGPDGSVDCCCSCTDLSWGITAHNPVDCPQPPDDCRRYSQSQEWSCSTAGWSKTRGFLVQRIRDEVHQHPVLLRPTLNLATSWAPAISRGLHADGSGSIVLSREMASSLNGFLEAVGKKTTDAELASVVESMRRALESESAIGRQLDEVVHELLASVPAGDMFVDESTTRLSRRERGLATDGDTLVVPAAAHVQGALGTRWRTDLALAAAGGLPALVRIAILPRDQDNLEAQSITLEIGSGRSLLLEDVLQSLFDFTGAAALRLTCHSGSVVVTSRTYNLEGELGSPNARTFGQFLPALCDEDAIVSGDQGRLLMLAHDPSLAQAQRTNLILVNGGAQEIEVEIELMASDGQSLGTVTRTLRAWEYGQVDGVFEEVTPDVVDEGYAIVRVTTSGGRVYALASVVDNLTGDPVAVPAVLRSPHEETTRRESQVIQAAARVGGFADTDWRTDLVLHGLTGISTNAQFFLLPRGQENTELTPEPVQVLEGQSLFYEDVLQSLFDTEGAGSIMVTPYGGAAVVLSRTYNVLGEGNAAGYPAGATFGQYLGPVDFSRLITFGEEGWISHLSHDPSLATGSRTNLGLVNGSPRTIDVEVDLHRGDGTLLGSFSTTLRAWENVQISKVFERVTGEVVVGGYAVVRTTHPHGYFAAHGSVVDNRTGDPITVDAVAVRKPQSSGLVATGDMLLQIFESGLFPNDMFELLRADGLADYLDLFAAQNLDRVTRTPLGIEYDSGAGTVIDDMLVSGLVSLEDETATDGTSVTGSVRIGFDDTAVDGLLPVVENLELGLDLARAGSDQMAGAVTVASTGVTKDISPIEGSLVFDTRICELYPIGGSITIAIGDELRTLTFTDACDGSFLVDIPSARFFELSMSMNDCDGGKLANQEVIHLIEEGGAMWVDPASPPGINGRRRFVARGTVDPSQAELRFGRRAGPNGEGSRAIGTYLGRYHSQHGADGYYSGTYGYSIVDGECRSGYYHGREDPDFDAAVLDECDGPCGLVKTVSP